MSASSKVKKALQPAALHGSLRFGRATSSLRMLPDFLIVGAQRCGTTSLYRALVQHPAVLRPPLRKGVHYFDTAYDRGFDWYRAHFPLLASAERAERRAGTRAVTFESSPYYMFHPAAGQRIARDLPGVRLVALVRDPVERAYSAYTHERARGFETESFERALELEEARLHGASEQLLADPAARSHAHQHHAYRARGRYEEQLARLAQSVGRDNVLVIDSHDFFVDPVPIYEHVLAFLGLPPIARPRFDQHNARPRSPMSASLRAELNDYFGPPDEALASWLGGIPSWRR